MSRIALGAVLVFFVLVVPAQPQQTQQNLTVCLTELGNMFLQARQLADEKFGLQRRVSELEAEIKILKEKCGIPCEDPPAK